jgi:hypothetical protein
MAKQIPTSLPDAGDAVLPCQHAGKLQHLERLGDGAAGTTALVAIAA